MRIHEFTCKQNSAHFSGTRCGLTRPFWIFGVIVSLWKAIELVPVQTLIQLWSKLFARDLHCRNFLHTNIELFHWKTIWPDASVDIVGLFWVLHWHVVITCLYHSSWSCVYNETCMLITTTLWDTTRAHPGGQGPPRRAPEGRNC